MKLDFKKWLNEVSTSTADVAVVPNRLFGSTLVPHYAQSPENYVKYGLGGKVNNLFKKKKNKFFDL